MSLLPRAHIFASSIKEKQQSKSKFQKVILNDIDKGRGCRVCGDACPGLHLHIWRKVCLHCSCPWELHDVPKVKPRVKEKSRTSIDKKKKHLTFSETPLIIPPLSPINDGNDIIIKITDESENAITNEEDVDVDVGLKEKYSVNKEKELLDDKMLSEIQVLGKIELPEMSKPIDPEPNSESSSNSLQIENESIYDSDLSSSHQLLSQMYLWYPADLTNPNLEKFMSSIPPEYRPIVDTEGAQNCRRSLLYQLPPQDSDYDICHPFSEKELFLMSKFVEQRDTKYRGQGIVKQISKGNCISCTEQFGKDELCILASLLGSNYKYHIGCFRCSKCLEFLQELHYYKKNKNIYCGRHHAELFGPRCAGCDEIIFADKVTHAEDRSWHAEHFCCLYCDAPLGGNDYVKSKDVIMCRSCFTVQLNAKCFSCKMAIKPEGRIMKYREKSWHQDCFKCSECDKFLKAEKFIIKGDRIHCSACLQVPNKNQSEISPASTRNCDVCLKVVDIHQTYMSSEGFIWHESCFACVFCENNLIGKPFLKHTAGLLCQNCYEERMAHTCNVCSKKIIKEGVKHDQNYYHRDCLICAICEIQLANVKFSTKDGKNICHNCNKKSICHQCSKEIIGKCFEFKNYEFHPKCFSCTGCNKVIAGTNFYQTRGALYCKKCAKMKTAST